MANFVRCAPVVCLAVALALAGCGPIGSPAPSGEPVPTVAGSPAISAEPTPGEVLLNTLKPVAPSPTGSFVAAGLREVTIYDWSGNGKQVAAQGKSIRGLFWSPRGQWLIAHAAGPTVLLIRPATDDVFDLTDRVKGLRDDVLTVSWAPDESEALVANGWSSAETSAVWLVETAAKSARKLTEAAKLERVQWLQGGKGALLVDAGCCGPVNQFISLETGSYLDGGFHGGGAYAPDGRQFMSVPYMGASLSVTDLVDGTSRTFWRDVPPGDPPPPDGLRYRMLPGIWSPDSRYIAYVTETWAEQWKSPDLLPPTLRVVDMAEGKQVRLVRGWAPAMEWLPSGKGLLYATKKDGDLRVYLENRLLSTHEDAIALGMESFSGIGILSADGNRLAYAVSFASGATQIFVADLRTGKASAVSDSADLAPLMWTEDGSQLPVAYVPVTRVELPGGGEARGREAERILWIHP